MNKAIAEFWSMFQKRADELAKAESADVPVYDALLEALHAVNPDLYFEFSPDEHDHELIVTAEGNNLLFDEVRAVVAAAPVVPGWRIIALKPKVGFPERVSWEGVTLALAPIVFEVLELEDPDDSDEIGIRILVPGLDEEHEEDAHNALLRAIDHGLGEEKHAASINYSEVMAVPEDEDLSDYFPLLKLDEFIDNRAKANAKKRNKRRN